jgi:hypothetical protein
MKCLSLFITSFITISAFAQQPTSLQLAKENRLGNLSLNVNLQRPRNIDNMPIGSVGIAGQSFSFNKGNGLNIYKSQPDNMLVAKPDGSYIDNMGVKRVASTTIADAINATKDNQFQPNGNAKFNFVFPSKKDSVAFVDSIKALQLSPKF